MENILIKNITKIIKNKKIIDNVSFTVMKGEIIGLIGPNGAGKTTLMKILSGLNYATSGEIRINGISISGKKKINCAKIGVLIEEPAAYEWLNGYQNLKILANMYSNVSDDCLGSVIDISGSKEFIYEKVSTYSLGMKKRLSIAFALLNEPEILILDEPTNGLDYDGSKEIYNLLLKLSKEKNITVIISSHILPEMNLICDKALFIKNGMIFKFVENKDHSANLGEHYNEMMEI